jgi:hypothetical protein
VSRPNLPTVGKTRALESTHAGPDRTAVARGMVEAARRWIVLSDSEQRVWSEIERRYDADSDRGGMSALAVGGVCIAIMFVVVGAPVVGLVLGGGTALGWLLWRYWRQVGRACETACLPSAGTADDRFPGGRRRTPEAE